MNRTASAALGAVVVHFVIAIRSTTWVEIARSAIDGARERLRMVLLGVSELLGVLIEPGPTLDRSEWEKNTDASLIHLRLVTIEPASP